MKIVQYIITMSLIVGLLVVDFLKQKLYYFWWRIQRPDLNKWQKASVNLYRFIDFIFYIWMISWSAHTHTFAAEETETNN